MKTLENPFLALGRTGRCHSLFYVLSFIGLLLIIASLMLLNLIFGSKFSYIQNQQILLAIQLSALAYILVVFLILASYIHKRTILSFISSENQFRFKTMWITFGLILGLNSIAELVNFLLFNQTYSYQFEFSNFIKLLLIAISLLVIQSATEEIILRGYLLQALTSWKKIHPIVALLLSSLFFATLHLGNPEFSAYGFYQMFVAYFTIALFLGTFAILGKGLEIPIGIHAANNFYAAVLVNYKGSALKTDALFIQNELNIPLGLSENILILFVILFLFYKIRWIAHPKTLLTT